MTDTSQQDCLEEISRAIHYVDDVSLVPETAVRFSVGERLDKSTLLNALALAGQFPSYFAHNWDSAWDCLTDSEVEDLQLDLTQVSEIDEQVLATFITLIEDAYASYAKPVLWIVMTKPCQPEG